MKNHYCSNNPSRAEQFGFRSTLVPLVLAVAFAIASGCGTGPESGSSDDVASVKAALGATRAVYYADLSGDGRADRITRTDANEFLVALATGATTYGPDQLWLQHGEPFKDAQQAQFVDLDANGKIDLMYRASNNSFWASISTGTSFRAPQNWVTHGGGYDPSQAKYADLDGDRRADLIFRGLNNSFWISISTGTAFRSPQNWVTHGGGYHPDQAKYADLDADGRADLIFRGLDNSFWVSLSAGTAFKPPQNWFTHGGGTAGFRDDQAYYPNLDADGRADLIFRGTDNRFWVSLSTGTSFRPPQLWASPGGAYAPGQAVYSNLNADSMADLTFRGSDGLIRTYYATGTGFTAPVVRDPACGNAPGCLVVTSGGIAARTISEQNYEPHYYGFFGFPPVVVKDLGMIRPGENITLTGSVASILSSSGSAAGSDSSDYVRFSVAPGVTVTGTTQNYPGTHLCSSTYNQYSAAVTTDPFPWSGEGYVRTDFSMSGCQSLGSSLYGSYTVNLQASGGQIFIRVEGPGGVFTASSTRGVFGLPTGTYTVRAGTDANRNGVLCEAGDFCASTTVTITDANLKNVGLAPQ